MATGLVFEDDHIDIELLSFNDYEGEVQLIVREKHNAVGFYYIFVNFESGDSTRIDYDGGNPNRLRSLSVRTTHRNDKIKEIVAKRIRD